MSGREDKNSEEQKRSSSQKKTKSKPQSQSKDGGAGTDKKAAERQRKAQLETKVRERVASEAKAFDIVNRLIEPAISAEYLLEACKFIDHNHYEDIVEERAISFLCGYPICNNRLSQVSKKKYQISTKTNTVYDITERKKFCSNGCYHASRHLHQQIVQTPVWSRRDAADVEFDLLQHSEKRVLEGEAVIGTELFPLKKELQQLEKMDQKYENTKATEKSKTANRLSHEESQNLSDQLLSLSTEEDLDHRMGSLSIGQTDGKATEEDTELSTAPESSLSHSEEQKEAVKQGSLPGEISKGSQDSQSETEAEETVQAGKGRTELDSAMGQLTVHDNTVQDAPDSDDDCSEDEKADSVDNKSVVSDTSEDVQKPECSVLPANNRTVAENEPLMHITGSCPQKMEADSRCTGMKLDHCERTKKLDSDDLQQKSGESKSAYLLRLLDRRRDLLSKVADIQTHTAEISQTPSSSDVKSTEVEGKKEEVNQKDTARLSEGRKDTQSPENRLSEGRKDTQSPENRLSEGRKDTQSPENRLSEGRKDTQSPENRLSEGRKDTQSPENRLSEGRKDTQSPENRLSEGRKDTQSPENRLSEGRKDTQSPENRLSEGRKDTQSPENRLSEGRKDTQSPENRLSEGRKDTQSPEKQNQLEEMCLEKSERRGEQRTADPEQRRFPQKGKGNVKTTQKTLAHSKRFQSSSTVTSAPQTQMSPLNSICQIISQWVTSETLTFLGLNSAQSQGDDEGQSLPTDAFHRDPEMQRKYENLCQRLAGQEKDFEDILGEEEVQVEERQSAIMPLPDYKELKQQMEEYQLKVHQFLLGPVAAKKKVEKQENESNDENVTERPISLPVVDSHNQLLIRRRIVLERLDRTMPSLLPSLGLSLQDVSALLRELIFTFRLTSDNIVFKPAEWTLVAIILLKMLTNKSQPVTAAFQSEVKSQAFNMVLSHLGHSLSSLGQLVYDTLSQCKVRLQDSSDH